MFTLTDASADRLRGRRVVTSISGGKDSAAMALWLLELGIEHERVFMDTGWEHQTTYEYLRGPLTAKLGQIKEIRATVDVTAAESQLIGEDRVGCGPCIRSRKGEIRTTADHFPGRIALLRELEVGVGRLAAQRMVGQEIKNPARRAPGFFQAPVGADGACWPIDEVVAWSRTSRGGRQFELFAPTDNEGCMRWGLCETSDPPPGDEE